MAVKQRRVLEYTVLLDPDEEIGGYTVTVPALPGIVTEGDTEEEALAMAAEAIRCHLAGLLKAGEVVPVECAPIKAKRIAVRVEASGP